MATALSSSTQKDWASTGMYVVFDPTYTREAPSHICTSCKVVRYFDAAHGNLYPHAKHCKHQDSSLFEGYVVGPQVKSVPKSKFQDVISVSMANSSSGEQIYGPYPNSELYKNFY